MILSIILLNPHYGKKEAKIQPKDFRSALDNTDKKDYYSSMTSPEPLRKEQKVRNALRKALNAVLPHARRLQKRYEQQFPDAAGKRPIEQIAHATDPARRGEVRELLTDHALDVADEAMHRIEDTAHRLDRRVVAWLRRRRQK